MMPRCSIRATLTWLLGVPALVVLAACVGPQQSPGVRTLVGAGATFPYPLYSKWVDVYERETGVRINYQSIGSGGGIRQLLEGTVDFGASDVPMTDEQLASAPRPILHVPTAVGAVAVVYNLPGLEGSLKLTPAVLGDLFLGRITRWNDPRLAETNPDLALPDGAVSIVHRSDGSGTTAILTEYLSDVNPAWQERVGAGMGVNWPVGLGGKGSEGVSGQVRQLPGSLGYVELAYAVQSGLPFAAIQNRAGRFVSPSLESTTAAAAGTTLPADLRGSIVDAPGAQSYPVAGFTYLLMYQDQVDQARGRALADFVSWCLHEGQPYATELGYASLPAGVVQAAEARLMTMESEGQTLR
jgi:phosphate transport system substrate-binding protein